MTASPARLVSMLYEGGIRFLDEAVEAVEAGDFIKANEKIKRVQDIVMELNLSLDMENGGSLAQNLRALYNYIFQQLIQANVKKDTETLKEVRSILSDLNGAWKEAMKSLGNTANLTSDPNKPRFNISI
ncbi:MAG: flagellar export chaperone FliS [Thermotogae bacterium]|nr:flagellar export chaperone FliS [Thermotogota bacterium]RKX42905.1 MAG: flagellar export chaperone FliS [Thermotogota bacterium]